MNLKKRAWTILLLILVLASLLRFWGIETESYWLDEAISIQQAQEKEYSVTLDRIKNDIHLPLHITLLHFWVKLFGTSELSSRSLSLLFGVIGIWIFYLIAKRLFDEKTGLVSSLIFAISPIMIFYSQEARLYTLFVLLSLLSTYFFLKYIDHNTYQNLFFYGLFSLLLLYTHLFAFLLLFVQNVFILYTSHFQIKRISSWLVSQLILALMFVPWVTNLLKQIASTLNTMWIPKPNVGIIFRSMIELIGNTYIALIFLFCILYVCSTKIHKTFDKDKMTFLALWAIVPSIIVLTYSYVISPIYHTRYVLFAIPALFIIFGLLIVKISEKNKILSSAIIGLILIFSFVSIAKQVNDLEKDDWRSVAKFVRETVKEDEYTFINPFYHHNPFTYYYDSQCFKDYYIHSCNYNEHKLLAIRWDAPCCNDSTPLTATDEKNKLKDYTNETIWLISVREELYAVPLFDFFNETMDVIRSKEFGEIRMYQFEKR